MEVKKHLKNIMEKKSVTVLQKFSTCVLFCVLLLSSAATAVAYNPFSIHPEKETITDGNTYEIHFDEYVDPSSYNQVFFIENSRFFNLSYLSE